MHALLTEVYRRDKVLAVAGCTIGCWRRLGALAPSSRGTVRVSTLD